jgi:hypothetical protein
MAGNLKLFYISNCIKRIMDAKCETRLLNRRVEDVALAVELAASDGLQVAHKYLIQLCNEAEAGKYATEHVNAADEPRICRCNWEVSQKCELHSSARR